MSHVRNEVHPSGSGGTVTQAASQQLLVPSTGPEAWGSRLARPDLQWKPGKSAWAVAHAWHDAHGLPPEVSAALSTAFRGVELLIAIPEWKTSLPGGGAASQTDVWALCGTDTGLASVAIEGKVDEPFGPTVGEWLREASPGKRERLDYVYGLLGLTTPPPDAIRYQLLHRTASAVREAQRFHAAHAVMLVQSFQQGDRWFEDFAAFAAVLGASPEKGKLVAVPSHAPCTLHLGWVRGDRRYAKA